MEDVEFEVLDELYFIIPYNDLYDSLDLEEGVLEEVLLKLANKGWLRIYNDRNEELDEFDLINDFRLYFYLVSKKGLIAHNR